MAIAPLQGFRFWYPCWASGADAWMREAGTVKTTFPAGVTFVTSPAHPLNTDQQEQTIHIDGNQSHRLAWDRGLNSPPPDSIIAVSAHRWAIRESFLIRIPSSMTSPSSRARLLGSDSANSTHALFLNTDMTLGVDVYNNSAVLDSTFTSVLTLPKDDNWYQLEIWCIIANSAGVKLGNCQWVVRTIGSLPTTNTVTTYINAHDTTDVLTNNRLIALSQYIGEVTTRGAGFVYDTASYFSAVEDADSPYGVIRGDHLYPNASGAFTDWSGGNNSADQDEMGDATLANRVPDDGTTTDFHQVLTGETKRNSYALTAPGHAASGDSIAGVMVALRGNQTGLGKVPPETGTLSFDALIDDGGTTNHLNKDVNINLAGVYKQGHAPFLTDPAAGTWGFGDLGGLEAGAECVSTASGSHNTFLTTVSASVAYQANGETTPAVAQQLLARQLFIRQAVNRAATY